VAWSTREIAELAGTTVKAVRHYHKLGLLDEPERMSNNYKQYQIAHLIRLLQITRLADLGVPLAQIAAMGNADQDPDAALQVLDAELAATVERLQRIRGELALILKYRAPAELPAGFSTVSKELTETDRSLIMVYSRVFDEGAMHDMQEMISEVPRTANDDAFEALTPDADRETRKRIAEEMAPSIAEAFERYPWLNDPGSRATKSASFAQGTMTAAVRELYNKAQLEVLYRAHLISVNNTDALEELDRALEAASSKDAANDSDEGTQS
jgi:DNA-binding transcriptional MerR regulator